MIRFCFFYFLFIIIIIIIIYSLRIFQLMVFHWSLSDSKSPQVSRTLLSILAVLNNVVFWMVSTCPLTSKPPFLLAVPKAPITIGIIVTFTFHSFSIPKQGPGTCPSFHFLSVIFTGLPVQESSQFYKFSFFVNYHKVWSSGLD